MDHPIETFMLSFDDATLGQFRATGPMIPGRYSILDEGSQRGYRATTPGSYRATGPQVVSRIFGFYVVKDSQALSHFGPVTLIDNWKTMNAYVQKSLQYQLIDEDHKNQWLYVFSRPVGGACWDRASVLNLDAVVTNSPTIVMGMTYLPSIGNKPFGVPYCSPPQQ
jgi:hypothetical protein